MLVKRHVQETGSDWFRQIADPSSGNAIITSRLSIPEVFSALNRRVREAKLDAADYTVIASDFEALVADEYEVINLDDAVIWKARRLLENYYLRAGDAVQLASAIVATERLVAAQLSPAVFIAADNRLLNAARTEGLLLEDARAHP